MATSTAHLGRVNKHRASWSRRYRSGYWQSARRISQI